MIGTPVRATLAGALLVTLLAPRSDCATPLVLTFAVSGTENEEGAYTGTAQLELDDLAATLTETATTSTGKLISWTGHGKLDAGEIKLTLDPGFQVPGATPRLSQGTGDYVLGDDGTISGFWQLLPGTATSKTPRTSRGLKTKPAPGGSETLVLSGGGTLPGTIASAPPALPANALRVPMVTQPDEFSCGASSL